MPKWEAKLAADDECTLDNVISNIKELIDCKWRPHKRQERLHLRDRIREIAQYIKENPYCAITGLPLVIKVNKSNFQGGFGERIAWMFLLSFDQTKPGEGYDFEPREPQRHNLGFMHVGTNVAKRTYSLEAAKNKCTRVIASLRSRPADDPSRVTDTEKARASLPRPFL